MTYTLITTGDFDGIGFEIICKSLQKIKAHKKNKFVLFINPEQSHYLNLLKNKKLFLIKDLSELKNTAPTNFDIFIIQKIYHPVEQVVESTKICLNFKDFSLVNAPLSKELIHQYGLSAKGHTDIFKKISGLKNLKMLFLGDLFSLVLATDHISYSKVENSLWDKNSGLQKTIELTKDFMLRHHIKESIAILGLNPHAGENGIIGEFERSFAAENKNIFSKKSITFPVAADSFFHNRQLKQHKFIVALYHDQGLIPFKILHKNSPSVHLTLGLPFIRTTVDHGTAKDIANSGKANYHSMLNAIKINLKLINKEKIYA